MTLTHIQTLIAHICLHLYSTWPPARDWFKGFTEILKATFEMPSTRHSQDGRND